MIVLQCWKSGDIFNPRELWDEIEFDNMDQLRKYLKRMLKRNIQTTLETYKNESLPYQCIMLNMNELSGTWLQVKLRKDEA